MQPTSPPHVLRRGAVLTLSALTFSVFAAAPTALAAASPHASSNGTDHSAAASQQSADAHHAAGAQTSASSNTASSHQTDGTSGTSGDPTQPQPLSGADQNTGGANGQCPGGAYCSTRDGSASGNGNGGGQSVGKPCAGCVGKADNKNPPGQMPNGSDHNAGYECDRNHGIARTNPAHTGCTSTPPPCDEATEDCDNPPPCDEATEDCDNPPPCDEATEDCDNPPPCDE